jgi:hypothetical protein
MNASHCNVCYSYKQHVSILPVPCCFSVNPALSVYLNNWNNRMWGTGSLQVWHEVPLHPEQTGIWCVFIRSMDVTEQDCWLQQYGTAAHRTYSRMAMLEEFFGNCASL